MISKVKYNAMGHCLLILLLLLGGTACRQQEEASPEAYLEIVLQNLGAVESASYHAAIESWQPGDTVPLYITHRHIMEYRNPADTTIGSSFAAFDLEDTTRMEFCYDGHMRALFYHQEKGIVIDDFTARQLPFRPVSPPFYNFTASIISYALHNGDSTELLLEQRDDHVFFRLSIHHEHQVEFFGRAHYMPLNPYVQQETSVYELWISRQDDLPYKVRRQMSHDISVITVSQPEFNKISLADFNPYRNFPADYEIRAYGSRRRSAAAETELKGQPAPHWVLTDASGQQVALDELQSKLLLIQFTGIGCGPCLASVTFLNELAREFPPQDLEVLAIESWARDLHALESYARRNNLDYRLLSATDEVISQYRTFLAVPVFFLLDEHRMIREVFRGFHPDESPQQIRESLAALTSYTLSDGF